ncbi:MAG: PEP-CTERM sorting domain-containing protein [bacterium]
MEWKLIAETGPHRVGSTAARLQRLLLPSIALLVSWTIASGSHAATLYASGQLLTPGDPGIPEGQPGHDDTRENFVYAIDTTTGAATPVSPVTSDLPSALGGVGASTLLGFRGGQLSQVDAATGAQADIGSNNGLSATAFDVTADGRGFILPFDSSFATQQLHGIDLTTGAASPIGSTAAVGDAIDTAAGNPLGTTEPFVISLGSVGDALYGVDLETNSLISVDSMIGSASVIGDIGAVGAVGGGAYSGFAALAGVDENGDGAFDALFGGVNFFDDDGDPATSVLRLGGIARFDLTDGTWSLVGTNPGVIYFGMASNPVPEPTTATLLGLGLSVLAARGRRSGPPVRD